MSLADVRLLPPELIGPDSCHSLEFGRRRPHRGRSPAFALTDGHVPPLVNHSPTERSPKAFTCENVDEVVNEPTKSAQLTVIDARASAHRLGVPGFGVFGHGPGAGAALRARLEIRVLEPLVDGGRTPQLTSAGCDEVRPDSCHRGVIPGRGEYLRWSAA